MADMLAGIRFLNPLPIVAKVTSTLGDPRNYGGHEGYDLAAPTGTRILAAARGTVARTGYMADGYGYYVEIDHGSGVKTLYGHMLSTPLVADGETVHAGQTIGYVGNTGNSSGPHLHFHILANGIYQDVARYVDLAVAGVSAAVSDISDRVIDAASFLRQQEGYCFTILWMDGSLEEYEECIRTRYGRELTPDEREAARVLDETPLVEHKRSGIVAFLTGEGPLVDIDGIMDLDEIKDTGEGWWAEAKSDIENLVYNIVFAPARAIIITFKLSDAPPKDGRATLEWLQAEKNTGLFITSIVLALLVLLLFVVAVYSFLMDNQKPLSTATKMIENPLLAAAATIENEAENRAN